MTGFAICSACSLVVKVSWEPSTGTVAGGTLIAIMIRWFIDCVTARAIRAIHYAVIKIYITPRKGRMTGRTVPDIVIFRLHISMTGFTICRSAIVYAFGMAILTLNLGMSTYQGIKRMQAARATSRKRHCQWIDGCIRNFC
jgi:hypothetical protein